MGVFFKCGIKKGHCLKERLFNDRQIDFYYRKISEVSGWYKIEIRKHFKDMNNP